MATASQRKATPKKPSARRAATSGYQKLENAAVRTKFQPQERALQGELGVSSQVQRNITNWFGNTQAEIQNAKNQALQAYAGAGGQLRQDANDASRIDAANRQQIASAASADAARRGTVAGDNSSIGAQAEAARRQISDAAIARLTEQGLAAGDYLNTRGIANSQQAVVAHTNEANHRASTRRALTDLKGQEGDFRITFKAQTQADNRKYQLEKGALGIKAGQLGVAQQNANTKSTGVSNQFTLGTQKNNIAQQNANTNQFRAHHPNKGNTAAQRRANRRDAAQRRNHTGPYAPAKGPKPPKDTAHSQNIKGGISNALSSFQRYAAQGLTGPQISAIARGQKPPPGSTKPGKPVPSYILNAARDLYYNHYLSGPNIATLRALGVHIPSAWIAHRQRSGTSTNNNTHGN